MNLLRSRIPAMLFAVLLLPAACALAPPSDEEFSGAFARVTLLFDS